MVDMDISKMDGEVEAVRLPSDMPDLIQEGFYTPIPKTKTPVVVGGEEECMERKMKREMIQLLVLKWSLRMVVMVVVVLVVVMMMMIRWMGRGGLGD